MDDKRNTMIDAHTVAIFGVFDGIHEGHRDFFVQAKSLGNQLVAIVARDSVVERLKNKRPSHTEIERVKAISEEPEIDLVFLGDIEDGSYKVLKEINPQIIYLGYDQTKLSASLNKAIKKGLLPKIEIIIGKPYKPEIFHTSLLNK